MTGGQRTIAIDAAQAGQRLDRLLRKLLRDVPLSAIFRQLRSGAIRVDGRKVDGSLRLVEGMQLTLFVAAHDIAPAPGPAPRVDLPAELTPRVVCRDDDLLIVDKPAGLASQPGSGRDGENLVDWLLGAGFVRRTATFAPAPAHRLDAGTSGLIAIGLSPHGLRGLAAAFRDDQVTKVYAAVVHGVPEPATGTIDAPLHLREQATAHEPKVVVDPGGQPARTDYEVRVAGPSRAELRLRLHTGRTHQLRAHLAFLGHPIVGDRRYGSAQDLGPRFQLHAAELALAHPRTGQPLHWTAPPPRWWVRYPVQTPT